MPFTEDTIAKYLQDPLSFPPEFKSWFVKYLEQHQPSLQAGLLAGKLPTSKLTGQIPYSQLTLANSIVSGDIVDGTIVNADINTAAAIAASKLAGYPTDVTKVLAGDGTWVSLGQVRIYNTVVVGSVQASITATIPAADQNYAALKIICQGRGDTAATSIDLRMRPNNDSGTNYGSQYVRGLVATASANESVSATSAFVGTMAAASATAGHTGVAEIVIPNYSGTTFFKNWAAYGGWTQAITTSTMAAQELTGVWASTNAITSIVLLPSVGNFAIGTRVTVYGMV